MLAFLQAFLQSRVTDEKGSVAAEYGLLIALIALAMAAGAAVLGPAIQALFEGVAGQL